VRWPGVEVVVPSSGPRPAPGELWALPLAASAEPGGHSAHCRLEGRPPSGAECRGLVRLLSHWHIEEVLPVCPFCAGVAFYQGPAFSRPDILTGWEALLLCGSGARRPQRGPDHPLLATVWANTGMPMETCPPIVVQLRPLGDPTSTEARAEVVSEFAGLWRSHQSSIAQNILSLTVPCSRRLCILGMPLAGFGMVAFFCEQIGKYALTSRTRVGRYLDDQPAHVPRAHVFGSLQRTVAADAAIVSPWPPHGSLEATALGLLLEPCPFCGSSGTRLRPEVISLLGGDAAWNPSSEDAFEAPLFHGELWTCELGLHLWGWRARRPGAPVVGE